MKISTKVLHNIKKNSPPQDNEDRQGSDRQATSCLKSLNKPQLPLSSMPQLAVRTNLQPPHSTNAPVLLPPEGEQDPCKLVGADLVKFYTSTSTS